MGSRLIRCSSLGVAVQDDINATTASTATHTESSTNNNSIATKINTNNGHLAKFRV